MSHFFDDAKPILFWPAAALDFVINLKRSIKSCKVPNYQSSALALTQQIPAPSGSATQLIFIGLFFSSEMFINAFSRGHVTANFSAAEI